MSEIKLAPPKPGRDLSPGNSAREAKLQDHDRRFDEIHVVSFAFRVTLLALLSAGALKSRDI
jgi:hypothetical protein